MKPANKAKAIGAALVAASSLYLTPSPASAAVLCSFDYYDVVQDVTTIYPVQTWTIGARSWKVAQTAFPAPLPYDIEDFQVRCTANGPELMFIRQNFSGLRDHKRAIEVEYDGDEARFLYHNLTLP